MARKWKIFLPRPNKTKRVLFFKYKRKVIFIKIIFSHKFCSFGPYGGKAFKHSEVKKNDFIALPQVIQLSECKRV